MRIVIEQAVLQKALARVTGVVSGRGTVPILSNVLIEAEPGLARFCGTNLEVEAAVQVATDTDPGGAPAVTVPARDLADIARHAPTGAQIEISYQSKGDDSRCSIRFGRSHFRLPILPAQNFARMPVDRDGWRLTIAAADLAMLIDQTEFAQSTEETRYYLNGVYFSPVNDQGRALLRLVATNGHVLALSQLDMAGLEGEGVVVPRLTVAEFRRQLDGHVGEVDLFLGKRQCRLETPHVRIVSKVVDGIYPDYHRVIPVVTDEGHVAVVDREPLLAAIKRSVLVAKDRTRALKLILGPGQIGLVCRNEAGGQAEEAVEADYDGPDVELSFNGGYLVTVLSRLSSERVRLQSGGPVYPCRFDPLDGDPTPSGDAFAIVMPMRT